MNEDVSLVEKKVLLVGPPNYSYPLTVKEEIENMGGIVHFYDERNNPSTLDKILLRKFPLLLSRKMTKYYQKIALEETAFSPDYVLFISPEAVSEDDIVLLKKTFKKATFILYMWDSIENKNAKKIYKLFDKCLSFDGNDCKKYGFVFRPLFFSKEYTNDIKSKEDFKYDFGFIGTTHSDRAKIIYKIMKYCDNSRLSYYFYLYIPGKLMFTIRFLSDKYVRLLYKKGMVHICTLDRNQVENIMEHTRYVVDVNHPDQTGLTMRTIEMLGLKRKLLTTNRNIVNYDFYSPVNQIIIDRKNICFDYTQISQPYETVSDAVFYKYRLDNWVKDVFS